MNYRKQGLRALGLSLLAALGLMAFAAAGAQASGEFLIAEPTNPNWLEETITGKLENALTSSLLILNLNHELICHEATVTGNINSHGHGHVDFELENCYVQGVSGGVLVGAKCSYFDIIIKTLALVILHEGGTKLTLDGLGGAEHKLGKGTPYILFTPLDGLTFATVVIGESECAMPAESRLKGCFVASIQKPFEDEVVKLISSKGLLELFGCTILYGANQAHLSLDALFSLSGSEIGKKWGAA